MECLQNKQNIFYLTSSFMKNLNCIGFEKYTAGSLSQGIWLEK